MKKAVMANTVIDKMSRKTPLPTPFIHMKKEKPVKQEVKIDPETQILGYEVLIRRRGDSFSIFKLVEMAKKKWLWWDKEKAVHLRKHHPKKTTEEEKMTLGEKRMAQNPESKDIIYINGLIQRWIDALEWYREMVSFLQERNFEPSIELFEQSFSLELAEFSTMYWNENVHYLSLEQMIRYHAFIMKSIKYVPIFTSEEEKRLESLQDSLIYTIESKFLNEFSGFVIRVLENFWVQENYIFDGKWIFNNSFTQIINKLNSFLSTLQNLESTVGKEIIQRVFMIVGYIITENFVGIFKNRFSINELFLIYAFIERFVKYFNDKTINHEKKLLYFDHLTSLMRVTLINIENYLRYFIVKVKDSYFKTKQIINLLEMLGKKFCLAKYISTSLSRRIWTTLLKLVVAKYLNLYFVRESLDIKTVDLASKLTIIEDNSSGIREFFEEFADTPVLNECIYNIMYLVKFSKATIPKDILDCIKIMINKDVVNSDANLSNILEMKSRHL